MKNKAQLKAELEATLKAIDLYSNEAVNLLLGTCAQESAFGKYRRQLGNGPALGIYQMEPFTYNDCHINFLKYKPDLLAKILKVSGLDQFPDADEMVNNDVFAACMCRVRYLRAPGAIPETVEGQAKYWKQHYNTRLGKGTVEEYLKNWKRFLRMIDFPASGKR